MSRICRVRALGTNIHGDRELLVRKSFDLTEVHGTSGEQSTTSTLVLVVSNNTLLAESLAFVLEASPTVEKALVSTMINAEKSARRLLPQVIIFDQTELCQYDSVRRNLRAAAPNAKMMMIVSGRLAHSWQKFLARETDGAVTYAVSPRTMLIGIQNILLGEKFVSVEAVLSAQSYQDKLACDGTFSRRERQVLELLASGLRNKEIAAKLGVAEPTVKMVVNSLFRKTGVENRTQLALLFNPLEGSVPAPMQIDNSVPELPFESRS